MEMDNFSLLKQLNLKHEMQHGRYIVNCAKITQIVVTIDQTLTASSFLF